MSSVCLKHDISVSDPVKCPGVSIFMIRNLIFSTSMFIHSHFRSKFRFRNHNLPIESVCRRGIPRNLNICDLCKKNNGDEFHYIYNNYCSHFENINKKNYENVTYDQFRQ